MTPNSIAGLSSGSIQKTNSVKTQVQFRVGPETDNYITAFGAQYGLSRNDMAKKILEWGCTQYGIARPTHSATVFFMDDHNMLELNDRGVLKTQNLIVWRHEGAGRPKTWVSESEITLGEVSRKVAEGLRGMDMRRLSNTSTPKLNNWVDEFPFVYVQLRNQAEEYLKNWDRAESMIFVSQPFYTHTENSIKIKAHALVFNEHIVHMMYGGEDSWMNNVFAAPANEWLSGSLLVSSYALLCPDSAVEGKDRITVTGTKVHSGSMTDIEKERGRPATIKYLLSACDASLSGTLWDYMNECADDEPGSYIAVRVDTTRTIQSSILDDDRNTKWLCSSLEVIPITKDDHSRMLTREDVALIPMRDLIRPKCDHNLEGALREYKQIGLSDGRIAIAGASDFSLNAREPFGARVHDTNRMPASQSNS